MIISRRYTMARVAEIIKLIRSLGINVYDVNESIYTEYIDKAYAWYRGDLGAEFHISNDWNGVSTVEETKAKFHIAKRICESHADLEMNENVNINVKDDKTREYLLGYEEMTGFLGQQDFWNKATGLYELVCALGIGAIEIVCNGLIDNGKVIKANKDTKMELQYHNALSIIPISWDSNREIKEIAFAEPYKKNKNNYINLRMHVLENGKYVIYNKVIKEVNGIYSFDFSSNLNTLDKFETDSDVPWFSVCKLNIQNNYDIYTPMGASVYMNCCDMFMTLDNILTAVRDASEYAKPIRIYPIDLLSKDEETGQYSIPKTMQKKSFYYAGDAFRGTSSGIDGKRLDIQDIESDPRFDKLCAGIQNTLDYISEMSGLGNSYFKFNSGSVTKTATEVISSNSELWRSVRRNELAIEKWILNILKSIIHVHNFIGLGEVLDENTKMSIDFDQSIIEDKTAERQRMIEEVKAGIISVEEYREKWYGMARRDTDSSGTNDKVSLSKEDE